MIDTAFRIFFVTGAVIWTVIAIFVAWFALSIACHVVQTTVMWWRVARAASGNWTLKGWVALFWNPGVEFTVKGSGRELHWPSVAQWTWGLLP